MINIINKNAVIVKYQSGESKREIAKDLGISRNTVDKKLIKQIQLGINKKRKILGYNSAESFFSNQVKIIINNTITKIYL